MALGGPSIYPWVGAWLGIAREPRNLYSIAAELTPEQGERYRREQEERLRKQQEANLRAEKLFLSRLTSFQLQEFQRSKEFLVRGSKGTRYWINCTHCMGNVQRASDGTKFCAGPFGLPAYDFWLAQKLLIEADEDAFLKVARQYPRETGIGLNAFFVMLPAVNQAPCRNRGPEGKRNDSCAV